MIEENISNTHILTEFNPRQIFTHLLLSLEFDKIEINSFYFIHKKQIDIVSSEAGIETMIDRFILSKMQAKRCSVCLEPIIKQISISCGHSFCSICINGYLNNLMQLRMVSAIKCMDQNCQKFMSKQQIRSILSGEQFTRYEKYSKLKQLAQDPNVRWCTRANCQNYITRKKDEKKLVCELCNQEICYSCGQSWHTNTCEEQHKLQYGKIVQDLHLQKCPQCGMVVEKLSGCNHMRCTKCNYQFCWLCLGSYGQHHYKWWNIFGCPKQQNSESFWKGWRYLFIIFFLPALSLLICTLLVVIVLIGVVGGFLGPITLIHKFFRQRHLSKRQKCLLWVPASFLILILYPFSAAVCLLPGSCIILYSVLRKL